MYYDSKIMKIYLFLKQGLRNKISSLPMKLSLSTLMNNYWQWVTSINKSISRMDFTRRKES